jgi:CDP-glucose 4,6-dehydratase
VEDVEGPVSFDRFAGRRVLVTGHTGFKGAWLVSWLLDLGAEVAGYALEAEEESHFRAADLARRMAHHVGDIRDAEKLRRVATDFRPEIVFHMAAQPLVRLAYAEPRETIEVNALGTVNLLEAVRAAGSVRACVAITSDKCYENNEWDFAYREDDTLGGHDPYSASKAAAEVLIASYRRSFIAATGCGLASARAGNVIGGGDWSRDRIVPDCVRALMSDQPVNLRNPSATRPWQHVLEPISGYMALASALLDDPVKYASAFNFGPRDSRPMSVERLVESFVAAWGSGRIERAVERGAPHEAKLLRLSIEKAAAVLGWTPSLDAPTAIQWTVDWYRAWAKGTRGAALAETTLGQIRRYRAEMEKAR